MFFVVRIWGIVCFLYCCIFGSLLCLNFPLGNTPWTIFPLDSLHTPCFPDSVFGPRLNFPLGKIPRSNIVRTMSGAMSTFSMCKLFACHDFATSPHQLQHHPPHPTPPHPNPTTPLIWRLQLPNNTSMMRARWARSLEVLRGH